MSDRKIRRILVIKNRAIGDTILTTGSLRLLRKHYPDHQIHVLVRSPAGELLEGLPYVDRVISAVEPEGRVERLAYWMRLLRRLREKKYELVVNFHASFRSALTGSLLRADDFVANHHELKGRNWFSRRKVPGRGVVKSVIDRDLDLLRALGIEATVADALPEVVLRPAEKREAAELFKNDPVTKGPRIFLGVGASRETKRWPPGNFAALVLRLATEHDASFVLSTVPGDRPWLDEFWTLFRIMIQYDPTLEKRIHHFSSASLRDTAKIISQCDAYLGNDSGMKHLAVALGLRTFTIFGPEAPLEWHPYDRGLHPYAFIDGLPCRTESGQHWCSIPKCVAHGNKCTLNITPDMIWPDLLGILKKDRSA